MKEVLSFSDILMFWSLQVGMEVLLILFKIANFATPEMLQKGVDVHISTFIAALLAEKHARTIGYAFQICDVLMKRMPDVFCKPFIKVRMVLCGFLSPHSQLIYQDMPDI
jgi:hypothetical protein